MKTLLIPAFVTLMAAPAFADAEDFGEKMLAQNGSNATAQTLVVAVNKLSEDKTTDRIMLGDNEIVSRSSDQMTIGHLQLARNMGVNPADFTVAELSAMYIGKYD
ncbi:hypothetical protein [uncultured Litoreibacter sp.]|uniref:hypothetical protein n=1 Tax=uncultured Litoreibacter sp. TaxID=1392394 RepID=UPI00260D32EB|nr:hypothetical protein [uncultured Litoreibacter sp.]